MQQKNLTKVIAVMLAMGMLLSYIPINAIALPVNTIAMQSAVMIDQSVLDEIEQKGEASYWIEFENNADLSPAYSMSWEDRGWFVYETLKTQAEKTQAPVLDLLEKSGVEAQSFWIANRVLVKQSNYVVLSSIQNMPWVTAIRSQEEYILYEPEESDSLHSENPIEPNLSHVNAPEVWALGVDGSGIVVANIDTGVRYTHQAIGESYRGNNGGGSFEHNYNWYNPNNPSNASPRDAQGHGTHTMGTMIGDDGSENQIGIAPGAEWIACAGCTSSGCTDDALMQCSQFLAVPHDLNGLNPNPGMRPNVINNSWGNCQQEYNDMYADVIQTWHALGIYPVFSNGNNTNCGYSENPPLNTVGNPARYGNVTGVGSSGRTNGEYASHSNKGPTDNLDTINPVDGFSMMKPQVVAPGVDIRSSIPNNDLAYGINTGTSMAAPHVSGLVALIMQAAPCLIGDYATIETIIESTATPIIYDDGSPLTPENYPNFATGWGEINALSAVEAAQTMCTNSQVYGEVSGTDDTPIEAATLEFTGSISTNNRIVFTDKLGEFVVNLNPDIYQIEISAPGYYSTSVQNLVVENESSIEQNVVLESLPSTVVNGTVSDGGIEGTSLSHGYPLFAKLTFISDYYHQVVYTDPFTGEYSVTLLQDTSYTVDVESLNATYLPYSEYLELNSTSQTYDVQLQVPAQKCSTGGYGIDGLVESFDTNELPTGWTIENYSEYIGASWQFDDPGRRGNLTGGDGGFAIADGRHYDYFDLVSGLRTPVLDFTSTTQVVLEFDSHFQKSFFDSPLASIRISTDAGESWSTFFTLPQIDEMKHYSFDLTSELAGQALAMIEFRDEEMASGWWQIDNVVIGQPDCQLIPGGAVTGYVYDENSPNVKIIGAEIQANELSATTKESDINAGDGVFWLFLPVENESETFTFNISKTKYLPKTENRQVLQGKLNRLDFMLSSGKLDIKPGSIDMTMALFDEDQNSLLTLENIGSGTASFTLQEKDLGFKPMRVNIPAFMGEIERSAEPVSIFAAPEGEIKETPFDAVMLNANARKYGITEAPMAYGFNIPGSSGNVDHTVTWEEAAYPEYFTFGSASGWGKYDFFAGDFMGNDFDTLYTISSKDNFLYAVDRATDIPSKIGQTDLPSGLTFTGLTGGPGIMYGLATNCITGSFLYEIDLETAEITEIASLEPICLIDIAYVPEEDKLYSIDLMTDALYQINPDTGEDILVGSLGVDVNYAQGLDYDEANGILYWAAHIGYPQLRVIDTKTGASDLIGEFPFPLVQIDSYAIVAGDGGSPDRLPWLVESPIEGTISENNSLDLNLTFSVATIDQPGDYPGELLIKDNTPYNNLSVPVTLHVTRPPEYGSFKGKVSILEKCDVNPTPSDDVMINFLQDGEIKFSTKPDRTGYYSYAIPAGTYDIEFLLDAYVDFVFPMVTLAEDSDHLLEDVFLRLDEACLIVDTESIFQTISQGQSRTLSMTFTNIGAKEAVFDIVEKAGAGPVNFSPSDMEAVELALDDGEAEEGYGFQGTEYIIANHFTPDSSQFPFSLEEIQISFDLGEIPTGVNEGDPIRLLVYKNDNVSYDPSDGSELLYQQEAIVRDANGWNTYALDVPVIFEEPTDIMIAVIFMKVSWDPYMPGMIDTTSQHQRSWLGLWNGEVPAVPVLPPDGGWILTEWAGVSGTWLLRGKGTSNSGLGGDIVWLTVDPRAEIVYPDGDSVEVNLFFDTTDLEFGDYFGTLEVNNVPDPKINIPVKLRVQDWLTTYLPIIQNKFGVPGK